MTDDDRVDILLVDDRLDKLTALEAVLGELGQRIHRATSGAEALRLLLKREFAVILLDVHMPVIDGFETAALVRQRKKSEHTPIIFVTAVSDQETHVSRGYSLGAVDYIFSPVVPEILRAKVSVFIDLYRKNRQIARQAEWMRAQAERRAERLETRLNSLLVDLDVGVYRADPGGRVVEANPAFLAHIGAASLEDQAVVEFAALLAEAGGFAGGEPDRVRRDVMRHGTGGDERWFGVSLRRSPDGWVDGIVEDVTARKEAESALRAQTDQLARSNADLEQFAYIASHDLQEPLRTIQAFSTLIVRRYADALDDDARTYLGFVIEGAQRMNTLIRDLLAYNRTRTESHPLTPIDCDAVADRALQNLHVALEERQAVVSRDPLPTVLGDETLLVQLFQNLVSNALKFSPGRPRVHLGARRCEAGWVLEVRDHGIGIAKEHQETIFGIFKRIHPRGQYDGNGIGLAICRRIVERHDGRIWVESAAGGGASFQFVLRAPEAPSDAAEGDSAVAALEPARPTASIG